MFHKSTTTAGLTPKKDSHLVKNTAWLRPSGSRPMISPPSCLNWSSVTGIQEGRAAFFIGAMVCSVFAMNDTNEPCSNDGSLCARQHDNTQRESYNGSARFHSHDNQRQQGLVYQHRSSTEERPIFMELCWCSSLLSSLWLLLNARKTKEHPGAVSQPFALSHTRKHMKKHMKKRLLKKYQIVTCQKSPRGKCRNVSIQHSTFPDKFATMLNCTLAIFVGN